MALSKDGQDREYNKFKEDHSGNTTILTIPSADYNQIEINYTDSTKAVISTVVYKLNGTTVSTLTLTPTSTKDTWVRS